MKRICMLALSCLLVVALAGCPKSKEQNNTRRGAPAPSPTTGSTMNQPEHGPALELGSATIGAWTVRAAREDAALAAGGEAPVDLWVTGGSGQPAAVRIWIGTEAGTESVKGRANVESSDDPTHYHAHAEAPTPIPEGSMLWVELQDESGAKSTGSFELKR